MELDITLKQSQNLLDSEQMKQLLTTLVEYHQRIVEKALSALKDEKTAIATWQRFMQRLDEFPRTMPLPQGTFADYPKTCKKVLKDNFFPCYEWIKNNLSDPHIREQAILRNIFYFAEYAEIGNVDAVISPEELRVLHEEFAALDHQAETYWLSRMFDGLQTSLGEVYVVECYFKNLPA